MSTELYLNALARQNRGEILKGVAESATDIGIVASNVHSDHLQMLPYRDDRLVLVTSVDHPLAHEEVVDFARALSDDFVGLPTTSAIHAFMMTAADAVGVRLKLRIQVGNF